MTTHTLKQCRPDHKETEYFWKLFHAAQRNDARWHGSEIEFIAEELSRTDLDRNQKLFLLRAWQVLIDDKGGFGRFMGAFDTYVYNMQDPNDECVSWKPELSKLLHDGVLLGVVLEAYDEALQGIAELSMENVALALTIEKCREVSGCPAGVDLQDHLRQLAAENMGLKEQVRALAEDNSALINSSVCALQDGRPPHGFYASEWFIAKLKNGEYAALKALPEEYSYDYRTNDGTYYTKDWVVGWMQTPDTEYRPNVKTPATDRIYAGIKADGVEKLTDRLQKHLDEGDFSANEVGVIAGAIHCGREMAQQLREGAK